MSTTEKEQRLSELHAELATPEPTGQRRLREAREHAAALDTAEPATPEVRMPKPADEIHFLESGRVIPLTLPEEFIGTGGHITTRGETVVVTDRMLRAAVDRFGRPGWPALVHDEAAQIARYGSVWVRAGRAPEDMDSWLPGTPEWSEAREQARREAHQLPTEQQRADALAEVARRFGAPPVTSTTLNSAKTSSERAAAEQDARLRAAAVKGAPNVGPSKAGV